MRSSDWSSDVCSSDLGRLVLSADGSILGRTQQVVVVIGTPVDEFLAPSMTVFERTVEQMSPWLRDGSLVVLPRPVYPGTTEFVARHLSKRHRSEERRVGTEVRENLGGRRYLKK